MWQHRKLILIFYKPLFIGNLVFDGLAIFFLRVTGWHLAVNVLFIKAVGYALLMGYQYTLYNQVYFYYRNAGVSVRKMYGYVFGLDFCLFLFMLMGYFLFY
jgi:hypothetical protein